SQRNPVSYADTRAAWQGVLSERLGPVRIEAASYGGKPVSFEVVGPWTVSEKGMVSLPAGQQAVSIIGQVVLIVLPIAGGAFFARRNLRLGRGDQRGAT